MLHTPTVFFLYSLALNFFKSQTLKTILFFFSFAFLFCKSNAFKTLSLLFFLSPTFFFFAPYSFNTLCLDSLALDFFKSQTLNTF